MKLAALTCVVAFVFLTVTTIPCLASDQTTSWNEVMAFVDEGVTYVNNNGMEKALEEFKKKGIEVIQSGKFDEDEFYYLDTEASLGTIYEIGNNGKIREPERRYPHIRRGCCCQK